MGIVLGSLALAWSGFRCVCFLEGSSRFVDSRSLLLIPVRVLRFAQDAAAELELSCGPSTTQLEAAEDHGSMGSCHAAARQEMQD